MRTFLSATDKSARAENVPGEFYVDHTCIDCDCCRSLAPETYSHVNGQSAVTAQPESGEGRVRALRALISCPTFSIHADKPNPEELRSAQRSLPSLVPGTSSVYECGWRSKLSYGGAGYLIVRPASAGGNILVDSPRFNPVLVQRIEALGGVSCIFLTHKDDVADHAKWASHFKAPRILHAQEVTQDTVGVEVKLEGQGPWRLSDVLPGSDPHQDVELIFTPGHSPAHVCLLYRPDAALCSGDHLSFDYRQLDELYIFKDFNWYSVPEQLESVRKLLDHEWLHVLPGHGRMGQLRDSFHRLAAVSALLERHGAVAPTAVDAK